MKRSAALASLARRHLASGFQKAALTGSLVRISHAPRHTANDMDGYPTYIGSRLPPARRMTRQDIRETAAEKFSGRNSGRDHDSLQPRSP